MHRCMAVQEILSIIFNLIYSEDLILCSQKLCSLTNLARTCKIFYEPAITILWSQQISIAPLVRCLPSDAYVERKESGISTLKITRDLCPSDFHRIRFFALKIKDLNSIDDFTRYKLSPEAFALLLLYQPSFEPLLPNLRRLRLTGRAFDGGAVYPRLVVSRCLESVNIAMEEGSCERSWPNIRTILSPCAPTLKSFTIDDGRTRDDEEMVSSPSKSTIRLLQLCSTFVNLVHLKSRIVKLDDSALVHISTLPFLQKLDLHLCDVIVSSFPELAFDQLTDLTLETTNLDNVGTFLSSVSFERLRTILIERSRDRDETNQWNFSVFSEVLCNRHRNCPLASITLNANECFCEFDGFLVPETPLNRADITPLFVFPHISTLAIQNCSINLGDEMLMEMSKAWPKLRILHLQDNMVYNNGQPRIFTPAGVISFARSCPHLESLMMCFDAEKTPVYANYDARSSTPPHLMRLDVCHSPIDDAEDVAQFLVLAFPNLQEFKFESLDDNPSKFDGIWRRVDLLIREILIWRSLR